MDVFFSEKWSLEQSTKSKKLNIYLDNTQVRFRVFYQNPPYLILLVLTGGGGGGLFVNRQISIEIQGRFFSYIFYRKTIYLVDIIGLPVPKIEWEVSKSTPGSQNQLEETGNWFPGTKIESKRLPCTNADRNGVYVNTFCPISLYPATPPYCLLSPPPSHSPGCPHVVQRYP